MDPDFAQRRRVAVALAITAIGVPAVALFGQSDDGSVDDAPAITLVGGAPTTIASTAGDPAGDQNAASATDPMGTLPIGYLEGDPEPHKDEPATIAIQSPTPGVQGTASFDRDITDPTRCQVDIELIPFGETVTVVNLDNSQRVRCIASVGGEQPDDTIILSEAAYSELGDITDVPIPVRVTW